MNPGWVEMLLRVLVAVMASAATVIIIYASRLPSPRYGPTPLLKFLGVMVGANAAWRWMLVALGAVDELPSGYSWVLAWVQPMNAALLFVLYFALFLLGIYHIRRARRG